MNLLRLDPDRVHEAAQDRVQLASELELEVAVGTVAADYEALSERGTKRGLRLLREGLEFRREAIDLYQGSDRISSVISARRRTSPGHRHLRTDA